MKNVRNIFMYGLGGLIVIGTFVLISMLVWVVVKQPESPLKETLVLSVGSLLAAFGLVVGYFFGSSKGSADKQDSIDKKLHGNDGAV